MISLLGPLVLVLSWVAASAPQEGASPDAQAPTQQKKSTPPVALPAEPKPLPVKPMPPVALPQPKPAPAKPMPPVALPAEPKPLPVKPVPPVALPSEQKPAPPVTTPLSPEAAVPVVPPTDPKAATPTAPASAPLSPEQIRRGPSLFETGRVGKMGVADSGVQIRQNRARSMPQELPVQNKVAEGGTPAPAHAGVINAAVLKREIRSRFALLRDCPVEVARSRRAAPESINASRLTLRWTILPGGKVSDTQVVATASTDGHVMDCVKREMSRWSFTPPRGGPVRVERPFKFRSVATPAAPAGVSDPD